MESVIGAAMRPRETCMDPDGTTKLWVGDFVVVGDGHDMWLGVPRGCSELGLLVLRPAYAYIALWPIQPNGQIPRLRAIAPLESITSGIEIEVRPASVFRIAQLDVDDREMFTRIVIAAEEQRQKARAARSGLVLPTLANGAPRRS